MKIDECINSLGFRFSKCIKTYAQVSEDDDNHKVVVDEKLRVICYDDVASIHRDIRKYKAKYKSNDALFVDDNNNLYFIEFKSGTPKNTQLRIKSSESLLIALDLGLISSIDDSRKRVEYLLVCDDNFLQLLHAHAAHKLYGGIESQKWLFKRVRAYTPFEFKTIFIGKHYISGT